MASISSGAANIVTQLLEHPLAKHFQHDHQHKARIQANSSLIETKNLNQDLNQESNSDILVPCKKENSELSRPCQESSSEKIQESNTDQESSESLCSESSISIPSSLSTDAPPSIFSYSSYQPSEAKISPSKSLSNINLIAAQKCVVNVVKMSLISWMGPNHPKQDPDSDECMETESNSTGVDVIDVSEDVFVEPPSGHDDVLDERYANYALDLNELNQMVKNGGVSSVLDLYLNINKIIEETPIETDNSSDQKQDILNYYKQLFQESFPWFNVDHPSQFWSEWEPQEKSGRERKFSVKLPSEEHSYSQPSLTGDRKRKQNDAGVLDSWHDDDTGDVIDKRRCCLCSEEGDGEDDDAGRLLPYRYNEWIHLNCALWSSEVNLYEVIC